MAPVKMSILLKNCENLQFPSESQIQNKKINEALNNTTLVNIKNNRSVMTTSSIKGSFYFEVILIEPDVRIGICTSSFDKLGPVGSDNSYGYGSIKGYKYHNNVRNYYYEKFDESDIISVFKKKHILKFYKNGRDCGVAFKNLKDDHYFPCISFYGKNASVDVNFGPCFGYFDCIMKYENIKYKEDDS